MCTVYANVLRIKQIIGKSLITDESISRYKSKPFNTQISLLFLFRAMFGKHFWYHCFEHYHWEFKKYCY